MFDKLLGKNKQDSNDNEIAKRISKMDLNDMRIYVNNKLTDFTLCEDGLIEVMKRLISKNEKSSKNFIEDDAMDVKKKKAFDLVVLVSASKKITVSTVELIQEFIDIYIEMILKFDQDNKQTYESKLRKSIESALVSIAGMSAYREKMDILGN